MLVVSIDYPAFGKYIFSCQQARVRLHRAASYISISIDYNTLQNSLSNTFQFYLHSRRFVPYTHTVGMPTNGSPAVGLPRRSRDSKKEFKTAIKHKGEARTVNTLHHKPENTMQR